MRRATWGTPGLPLEREVLRKVEHYRALFDRTGGGITISGGEPLLQPKFTAAVLRGCAESGTTTALDTSGAFGARATDELLLDTDLVLLDIKSFAPTTYTRITGGGDVTPDNIEPLADFVAALGNVERVDVLPFHALALPKYEALGLPFPLAGRPLPSAEQTSAVRARFAARGLTVT